MKRVPFYQKRAAVAPRQIHIGSHQDFVGGHDDKDRPGPIREHQKPADEEKQAAVEPPRSETEKKAYDRQGGLHDESAFVGRLPLRQKRTIVQLHTRGLLGKIYIERRAGEQRRADENKMS